MTTHRLCLVPDDEYVVAHHRRAADMLRHVHRFEQAPRTPVPASCRARWPPAWPWTRWPAPGNTSGWRSTSPRTRAPTPRPARTGAGSHPTASTAAPRCALSTSTGRTWTSWPPWPQPHYVRQNAAIVVRPLTRLAALLSLPGDDDTDLLTDAAGTTPASGDLVLTEAQDAAYRRFALRWHPLVHEDETRLNAI